LTGQRFDSEDPPEDELDRLLPTRRGHFQYESGHHGDLWLDLERLCLNVRPIRRFAAKLA
jgi:orotate phosphoribosyltransferase